jgi:hypothetical protein
MNIIKMTEKIVIKFKEDISLEIPKEKLKENKYFAAKFNFDNESDKKNIIDLSDDSEVITYNDFCAIYLKITKTEENDYEEAYEYFQCNEENYNVPFEILFPTEEDKKNYIRIQYFLQENRVEAYNFLLKNKKYLKYILKNHDCNDIIDILCNNINNELFEKILYLYFEMKLDKSYFTFNNNSVIIKLLDNLIKKNYDYNIKPILYFIIMTNKEYYNEYLKKLLIANKDKLPVIKIVEEYISKISN